MTLPTSKSNRNTKLNLDLKRLDPVQERNLRSLVLVLEILNTTENEAEYFEASAEAMRLCSATIQQADFAKSSETINYSEQALEYSLEILQEYIQKSSVIRYDN